MKKELSIFLLGIFLISTVFAFNSEVTVISKPNSFTGAVLKLRVPGDDTLGDPIYPSNYNHVDVGVVKFNVETSLENADFTIRFTKDGKVASSYERGPFDMSNSSIVVDLRKKVELNVTKEIIIEEIINETNETAINETLVESSEVEPEKSSWKGFSFFRGWLTGFATSDVGESGSSNKMYYLAGVGLLFAGLLFFFVARRSYRKGASAQMMKMGRMQLDERLDELDRQ